MSENLNPEVEQPTDELNEEQLNEVAGAGGGSQQGILPYIEQDNVYKQNQPANAQQADTPSFNFTKITYN
jgi:hypothetical protein